MTAHTPLRCSNAMMATDAGADVVLLNTGNYPAFSDYLNETWTFNGTDWTNATAAGVLFDPLGPLPTRYHSVLSSQKTTGLVLFGGQQKSSTGGMLNDTWTYTAGTWTKKVLSAASVPSARSKAVMEFDRLNSSILFSGVGPIDLQADTWVWNGTAWTLQTPAHSPPGRYDAGMAYSGTVGTIYLFGGKGLNLEFNDLWSWNGTDWTQLTPTTPPSCRSDFVMTRDIANNNIVMFGGRDGLGVKNDTWTLNNGATAWTQKTPTTIPPGRIGSQMTYSTGLGAVVMFGGAGFTDATNDTWKWTGSNWVLL